MSMHKLVGRNKPGVLGNASKVEMNRESSLRVKLAMLEDSAQPRPGLRSGDNRHRGTVRGPFIDECGDVHRQVDATMAHGSAKVVVPIRAMQRVPKIIDVHDVGHVFDAIYSPLIVPSIVCLSYLAMIEW